MNDMNLNGTPGVPSGNELPPASPGAADAPEGNTPSPGRNGFGRRTFIAGVTAAVILGSVVGGAGGAALVAQNVGQAQAAPARVVLAQPAANVVAAGVDIPAIYKAAAPSIVTVKVTETQTVNPRQRGGSAPNVPTEGEGTGIVIDKDGHILTNAHVVSGTSSITVTLMDGTDLTAKVVGSDTGSDLALIQASIPAGKLSVATLGDSDTVQPGDPAIAIGSPFGLDHSVTAGIVSAVKRDWGSAGNRPMHGLIQIDTPINPGNSGGALLNAKGEVVGITTAIESPVRGSVGVGFAIPINAAKSLVPTLSSGATVQHPWLGISGLSVSPAIATQAGLKVNSGILVMEIADGSPAAKAGLKPASADASTQTISGGDVITAVDGHSVKAVTDISSYLETKKVGDSVSLSVARGSETVTVTATLAAWPDSRSG